MEGIWNVVGGDSQSVSRCLYRYDGKGRIFVKFFKVTVLLLFSMAVTLRCLQFLWSDNVMK